MNDSTLNTISEIIHNIMTMSTRMMLNPLSVVNYTPQHYYTLEIFLIPPEVSYFGKKLVWIFGTAT